MNTSTMKSSITAKSKSKSPIKNTALSPKKNMIAPTPPSPSLKKSGRLSEDAFIIEMKKMRQKLCNTLDAYILIFETNAPLRCLQHNSVLSLYCQTQQKLLCANCIFRNGFHKQHKVFPIDKCFRQIARDVDQMSRQAQREVLWADNTLTSILQYVKNQQKYANQAILNLAQIYEELQFELSKSFEEARKKILTTMDSVFNKKQPLMLELEFFKDIFLKNKPLKFQDTDKLQRQTGTISQNHLIFEHLVGCTLLQYSKMEGQKLGQINSKVKMIERKEIQKINDLKNLLEQWNLKNRSSQKQAS